MKWILVILLMAGVFYFAKEFMPNPQAVDISWVGGQLQNGMPADEVEKIAGKPHYRMRHQVGQSDVWYYNDRYDPNDRMIVHFIAGSVYRIEYERN